VPRTIIDISALQSIPLSNVNRDDTGSPKTASYGGVTRARVSSQAWKRAARLAFNETLDPSEVGIRTKRIVELLGERIAAKDPSLDTASAEALAKQTINAAGIKTTEPRTAKGAAPKPEEAGYLLFVSGQQLEQLADAALEAAASEDPVAALKAAGLKQKLDTKHSIDIALFGRMVAELTDLNVDASAQVAHALSVHQVQNEFDYFTAVDDHKANDEEEDAGAGMIGTVEFNSSLLYRYATVDVDALHRTLANGDATSTDATARAVASFVDAFVRSMPTGKQNTFANRTLPDAVVISVRDTQSVNLVGAFEQPVDFAGNRLQQASEKLRKHAQGIDEAYGTTPVASWVVHPGESADALDALGEKVSLADAVAALGTTVAARLA